ncbi:MAG: hypothetical protein QM779_13680 [Propionicimonas sp.]|uniref:hypothetical protein n=1 Tax=Propionicimonas sp. TaxID=1955623 RepID=UPI003D0F069F
MADFERGEGSGPQDDFAREERAFAEALRASAEAEGFTPFDPATVRRSSPAPSRPAWAAWGRGLAAAASVVVLVAGLAFVLPRLVGGVQGSASSASGAGGAAAPEVTVADAGSREPTADASAGPWLSVATPPLSPRVDVAGVWFEGSFYLVGGRKASSCPKGAPCPMGLNTLTDGASYDPGDDTWTVLADAPIVVDPDPPAVAGGRFYYLGRDAAGRSAAASYDPSDGSWRELPAPGIEVSGLVAAGDVVVAVAQADESAASVDEVFDPALGRWADLAADPFGKASDRSMVWVDGRLYLFSRSVGGTVRAAVADASLGGWTRLDDPPSVGGGPFVVGDRIVWLAMGRAVPARWFQPATSETGRAASPPAGEGLDQVDGVVAGGRFGASGHLYDPAAGTWTELSAPPQGNLPWQDVIGGEDGLLVVAVDAPGEAAVSYLPLG